MIGAVVVAFLALVAGAWWSMTRPDPLDVVVATSRSGSMASDNDPSADDGALYQAVVSANPGDDGLVVSAIVCISTCDYLQDLGDIGRADTMADAVARFGDLRWEPEELTIGGRDGVQFTLARSELEVHR